MPFNGSGTFNRLYSWVSDKAGGIPITASRSDAEDDGFATGLSTCITKDGQTTITANLPMSGFKHTGVANGTARTDYAAVGQVQDSSLIWCGTAGGTVNAITLSPTPAITAYVAGQKFAFISSGANTLAMTVAVSGLSAKSITKKGATALVANDVLSGAVCVIEYDGTQFQIVGGLNYVSNTDVAAVYAPLASPALTGTPTSATAPTAGTASTTIANMNAVVASQTGGFVNKFLNPSFVINNRGTSAITVTSGTPAYTSDGWIVSTTGASITVTPTLVGSNSFKSFNRLLITGAASVTATTLKQRIESYNCDALKGQTITVQFTILNQTGASITPTIAINNPTVQDNYGATTSILAATNLQACVDGAWTTVAYTFAGTGNEYLGLEVILSFGGSLNSGAKSVSIINPDIRATPGVTTGLNSAPPIPEIRTIQMEEDMCGRYVQKSFPANTAPAQNAGVTGAWSVFSETAATFGGFIPFNRRMRAAPTVTTYNPSAANANWRDVTLGADRTVTVGTISTNGFVCSGAASAASSNNQIHYFATAEL